MSKALLSKFFCAFVNPSICQSTYVKAYSVDHAAITFALAHRQYKGEYFTVGFGAKAREFSITRAARGE